MAVMFTATVVNPYTAYNPCGGGGAPGAAPNPGVGAGGSAPAGAQYVETGTDFGQFGVYKHDYYRQAVSNGQQGYAVIQAVFDAIEAASEEGLIEGEEAMAIQYSASHKPADKQMAMATAIS